MKLIENLVIVDPRLSEGDYLHGSPFERAMASRAPGIGYVVVSAPASDDGRECAAMAADMVSAKAKRGTLGRHVVVTDRPDEWKNKFLSNNVVDVRGKDPARVAADAAWALGDFGRSGANDDPFIIGDSHFFHKNIIRYCDRPWNSGTGEDGTVIVTDDDVSRMNEDMIARWNSVVGKDDVVYSTGDFCFGGRDKVESVFRRLNGRKRIVLGNHDRLKIRDYYDIGFDRVYDRPIVIKDFIILSHAPLQWVKDGDVFANVYAHVHNQEMYRDYTANSFCSSAERIDYTPVRLSSIIEKCRSVSN